MIDRMARYRFDQLLQTSACIYLPLLRVASSAQQISALPEYVCFPSGCLPEALASFEICLISDFWFRFYLSIFRMFLVLLVLLCSRTRYADFLLAWHLNLCLFFKCFGIPLFHSL